MMSRPPLLKQIQRGVAAVEFAIVVALLLALIFGIIEFGRLLFTINSVQEITRRAAREQVVNWVNRTEAVKRVAVLRTEGSPPGTVNFPNASGPLTVNFPGSPDIQALNVQLSFLDKNLTIMNTLPASPSVNFENCLAGTEPCIRFVRATLVDGSGNRIPFNVLAPYVPADMLIPFSTVTMPAEALGLL